MFILIGLIYISYALLLRTQYRWKVQRQKMLFVIKLAHVLPEYHYMAQSCVDGSLVGSPVIEVGRTKWKDYVKDKVMAKNIKHCFLMELAHGFVKLISTNTNCLLVSFSGPVHLWSCRECVCYHMYQERFVFFYYPKYSWHLNKMIAMTLEA